MPELQTILTYRAWRTNADEGNPLACACGMRGPKPYDEGEGLFAARSAGACPPRALDYADAGEGQALALR